MDALARDYSVEQASAEDLQAFLVALTELSAKHGIAITGKPVLFLMGQEDYPYSYHADEDSVLFRS
jgi:hypothetical protein